MFFETLSSIPVNHVVRFIALLTGTSTYVALAIRCKLHRYVRGRARGRELGADSATLIEFVNV